MSSVPRREERNAPVARNGGAPGLDVRRDLGRGEGDFGGTRPQSPGAPKCIATPGPSTLGEEKNGSKGDAEVKKLAPGGMSPPGVS